MAAALVPLDEQLMIPDLLRAAPQVRPVLDRYGLRGCGGEQGPVESLGFFARAHDVPIRQLLGDLEQAMDRPAPPPRSSPPAEAADWADAIYRPFFKAGIVVILTLGAVWGAYLLLQIGLAGSFTAAGLHEVNAHGHAQIFGWVGLFVMGFAYQAFPRFKHTSLSHPRLARLSLVLMIAGMVTRSVLEPVAGTLPALGVIAVAASGAELVAVLLFAGVIAATWRRSGKPLAAYDYYIASALFWFVVQTVYDGLYFAATLGAASREELVQLVATWQAPLREIQIHGFALLMVLGVSQRIFPHFYGLRAPDRNISLTGLVAINLAVVGAATGAWLMRSAGHVWAGQWYISELLLFGTVLILVQDWQVFSAPKTPDRSWKFLRAAYVWLLLSLGMLVFLPIYQQMLLPPESPAASIGFSHAYYGAARHAITVGFVSLMIVGVAAKVVPTLNGVDVRGLSGLWGPFLLLNAGCLLRVTGQVLTDFYPVAFPIAGVSGLLEVAGLGWWGVHLWRVMSGRVSVRHSNQESNLSCSPLAAGQPIRAEHAVGQVLERYPQLLDTFLAFGFTPLRNPLLRRLLARNITVAQAEQTLGIDPGALLAALNHAVTVREEGRVSLPVLSSD